MIAAAAGSPSLVSGEPRVRGTPEGRPAARTRRSQPMERTELRLEMTHQRLG